MIGGGVAIGRALAWALPFFVVGLGLWVWVLVRTVPAPRWRQPGHWAKTLGLTAFVVIGLAVVSWILGLLTAIAWATLS